MGAVAAVVVVVLLLAAGVGAWFGRKYWLLYKSRRALADWTGANLEYGRLHDDARPRTSSLSSVVLADVAFARFVNHAHGFSVAHPKDWSVNAARSHDAPIVVQFACAHSERVYKTFSVVRARASD